MKSGQMRQKHSKAVQPKDLLVAGRLGSSIRQIRFLSEEITDRFQVYPEKHSCFYDININEDYVSL
jgi:hypothetical protein